MSRTFNYMTPSLPSPNFLVLRCSSYFPCLDLLQKQQPFLDELSDSVVQHQAEHQRLAVQVKWSKYVTPCASISLFLGQPVFSASPLSVPLVSSVQFHVCRLMLAHTICRSSKTLDGESCRISVSLPATSHWHPHISPSFLPHPDTLCYALVSVCQCRYEQCPCYDSGHSWQVSSDDLLS